MSSTRQQILLICLKALDQGLIPEQRREEVRALIESFPSDWNRPEILVERGLLSSQELDHLLVEVASTLRQPERPAPEPRAHGARGAKKAIPDSFLQSIGGGRYEIQEEVGRGAMGIVYRAYDQKLKRLVAVKVLPEGALADEEKLRRFEREAQAAAGLHHPNIVPIYDIELSGQFPYFTMHYVDGGDLRATLAAGPMDPETALYIFFKVARAIAAGHRRGLVHRDIKPSNIIIDEEGEPYVADFGLARDVGRLSDLTEPGCILGTPAYMSPEQLKGESDKAGPASDVFALGATLYHMLTGKAPFGEFLHERLAHTQQATPLRDLNPAIPTGLEETVLRALESDPGKRWQTADDLLVSLEDQSPLTQPTQTPMIRGVDFSIQCADICSFEADVVALKHTRGFLGASGSVAGALVQAGMAVRGLEPGVGAYSYLDTHGGIRARHVLFVGAGRPVPQGTVRPRHVLFTGSEETLLEFDYVDVQGLARRVLDILAREAPDAKHVAMTVHGVLTGLNEQKTLRAQFAGILEAIRSGKVPRALQRITIVEMDADRAAFLRSDVEQNLTDRSVASRVGVPGRWGYRIWAPQVASHERGSTEPDDRREGAAPVVAEPIAHVTMTSGQDMEDVFYYGIQQAAQANGFVCERVHHRTLTEATAGQLKRRIEHASVVIADLTTSNPMVYLQVGYALSLGRPTILLAKGAHRLPFDLRSHPCIAYNGIKELEAALSQELKRIRDRGMA